MLNICDSGGPGGSGKSFMSRLGNELAEAIGPDYDIFGFDPRGIGETLYVNLTKV